MDKKRLTSENGKPIADNQNIQTADVRGPAMLQDVWYLEKLAHFDREVIPERRMHAKGSGAFGTFTVTHDITKYTRASIFSQVGKKTDCLVRFSTVAGERGAADAEAQRSPRESLACVFHKKSSGKSSKLASSYSHSAASPVFMGDISGTFVYHLWDMWA